MLLLVKKHLFPWTFVNFLAALVVGFEKNEAEAVQAILRGHTMKANERNLWPQFHLELLDALKLHLTLLSVVTEVSLFFSLIEDHIADTLIVTDKNADSVWLVILAKLPRLRLLIRLRIVTDHFKFQIFAKRVPQGCLQGYQVVVPILILNRSDRP